MATVTHRTALADTTNAAIYTTSAFTPSPGDLLVVSASAVLSLDPGTLTASANGITFTRITTAASQGTDTAYLFVANQVVGATPAAMTVTLNLGSDSASAGMIQVASIGGMTKVGAAAVLQSAVLENGAATASPTATFAAAPKVGNPQYLVTATRQNPTGLTEPAGWTLLSNASQGSPAAGAMSAALPAGGTNQTVGWASSVATNYGAIVAEFDAPAPTGATLPAAGTVAAATATAGATTRRTPATGTTPATTTTAGAATARLAATGVVAATSTITGSATAVTGPSTQPASGTIPVTATTTATARLHAVATGAAAATATPVAEATMRALAAGTADATSGLTGSATIHGQVEVIKGATQVTLTTHRTQAAWNTPQPGTSVVISTRATHVTL